MDATDSATLEFITAWDFLPEVNAASVFKTSYLEACSSEEKAVIGEEELPDLEPDFHGESPEKRWLVLICKISIYFQSVKGDSAIMSGVYTLPFIGKTRLPIAAEFVSPLLALIDTILFYQMDINTSKAWYVGAQIPFGLGIGLGNQATVIALQAFAKPAEVAATMGIIFSQ
ncbi:hypothetical protein K458DRAFT_394200 [Lentithecium fluviatile CBS 122367]|uniref:MFS general substrate transporter n=1 Tax=Lentithecium fluviatile CBS 122367 TaxID=1168545 RepID=A0A6G1IM31_9PLEO|nr:hypothetical protein K458DRAFT_394200 [Lentithecium fluviatile CBS 122367]